MTESTVNDYVKIYDDAFYRDRDADTRYAAGRVLSVITPLLPGLDSVADVGCGVGTWLSVLSEQGISNVHGFDGHWVDRKLLQIPEDAFTEADLQQPIEVTERFDLAVSLEVAEHLPEESADRFVDSLTRLSDFVLFSAAIPFQGGVNHVNEQWQSYWAEKFAARNYAAFDPVRPEIWNDQRISIPYRQNMILYVSQSRRQEIDLPECGTASLSVAHPEMYELRNSKSIRQALQDLKSSTSTRVRKMIGQA